MVGSAASKPKRMRTFSAKGVLHGTHSERHTTCLSRQAAQGAGPHYRPADRRTAYDLLLGPFGSPESRAEYRRVLAELEAGGGRYRLNGREAAASGLTVNELCLRFWRHAESHYRLADGSASRELGHYQSAQAVLLDLYCSTLAAEFGPLKLKAVRQKLVDTWRYLVRFADDSQGWDRWVGGKPLPPAGWTQRALGGGVEGGMAAGRGCPKEEGPLSQGHQPAQLPQLEGDY
jgi:hypothetical protein